MSKQIRNIDSFLAVGNVINTGTLTAATTVTIPARAQGIILTVEGANCRMTYNNQLPSGSVGLLLTSGSIHRFQLPQNTKVSFIEQVAASGSSISYQFISLF